MVRTKNKKKTLLYENFPTRKINRGRRNQRKNSQVSDISHVRVSPMIILCTTPAAIYFTTLYSTVHLFLSIHYILSIGSSISSTTLIKRSLSLPVVSFFNHSGINFHSSGFKTPLKHKVPNTNTTNPVNCKKWNDSQCMEIATIQTNNVLHVSTVDLAVAEIL